MIICGFMLITNVASYEIDLNLYAMVYDHCLG